MELDKRGAELLFQVLTEREEKNSVAIARAIERFVTANEFRYTNSPPGSINRRQSTELTATIPPRSSCCTQA